jgi:hypothetical protein
MGSQELCRLASNCNPPDLSLTSSQDYRDEPRVGAWLSFVFFNWHWVSIHHPWLIQLKQRFSLDGMPGIPQEDSSTMVLPRHWTLETGFFYLLTSCLLERFFPELENPTSSVIWTWWQWDASAALCYLTSCKRSGYSLLSSFSNWRHWISVFHDSTRNLLWLMEGGVKTQNIWQQSLDEGTRTSPHLQRILVQATRK